MHPVLSGTRPGSARTERCESGLQQLPVPPALAAMVREEAELGLDGVKRVRSSVGQRRVLIEDSGRHRRAFKPYVEMI